ncbi:hypothetical protein BJ508DRAFT_109067 [Ascobolus immersus RN42]|uniref:Hypervirulence associated protein TUDOR domain-containing protein n=1 Tax=Ascobolus immersus RN42 TaxID=1160509 RepID=A0A3N4HNE5_ASCIM|nr:hypothetical protein BJ508DRAFT_109067 [Ascobolus immersus RN42]
MTMGPAKQTKDLNTDFESSSNSTSNSRSPPPRSSSRGTPGPPSPSAERDTKFQVGDSVEYKPVGGPNSHTSVSTGTVERILTERTAMGGDMDVHINASPEDPRYEIRNIFTDKTAAYKEPNIMRKLDDGDVVRGRPISPSEVRE